jgi:hypothetical protein
MRRLLRTSAVSREARSNPTLRVSGNDTRCGRRRSRGTSEDPSWLHRGKDRGCRDRAATQFEHGHGRATFYIRNLGPNALMAARPNRKPGWFRWCVTRSKTLAGNFRAGDRLPDGRQFIETFWDQQTELTRSTALTISRSYPTQRFAPRVRRNSATVHESVDPKGFA